MPSSSTQQSQSVSADHEQSGLGGVSSKGRADAAWDDLPAMSAAPHHPSRSHAEPGSPSTSGADAAVQQMQRLSLGQSTGLGKQHSGDLPDSHPQDVSSHSSRLYEQQPSNGHAYGSPARHASNTTRAIHRLREYAHHEDSHHGDGQYAGSYFGMQEPAHSHEEERPGPHDYWDSQHGATHYDDEYDAEQFPTEHLIHSNHHGHDHATNGTSDSNSDPLTGLHGNQDSDLNGMPHSQQWHSAATEEGHEPEGNQQARSAGHGHDEGQWTGAQDADAPGWYQNEDGTWEYWAGEDAPGWFQNEDGSWEHEAVDDDGDGPSHYLPHPLQAASGHGQESLANGFHDHSHHTKPASRDEHGTYQHALSPSHRNGLIDGYSERAPHWPANIAGSSATGYAPRGRVDPPQDQQSLYTSKGTCAHGHRTPSYTPSAYAGESQTMISKLRAVPRFEQLHPASSRGSEGDNLQQNGPAWTSDKRAGGALEGLAADQPQGPHAAGYLKRLQDIGLCLSFAATGSCPNGDDCKLMHGLACPVRACPPDDQCMPCG